ncbi:MAG: 50S ribosomal protein L16 [archaeon]
MALRKAGAYSKRYTRPYTRKSKVQSKAYIKAVPPSKVVKFKMGDIVGFDNGKYPIVIHVIAKEAVQMRDNSIEAVRQYLNRFLVEKIGKEFYLEVKVYPHHIQRENKMLTGAGADRMQTGMSQSFGRTVGRAALVKAKQTIFIVGVKDAKQEAIARDLIRATKARMPCQISTQTVPVKKKVA